jgi:hypothetical protein
MTGPALNMMSGNSIEGSVRKKPPPSLMLYRGQCRHDLFKSARCIPRADTQIIHNNQPQRTRIEALACGGIQILAAGCL